MTAGMVDDRPSFHAGWFWVNGQLVLANWPNHRKWMRTVSRPGRVQLLYRTKYSMYSAYGSSPAADGGIHRAAISANGPIPRSVVDQLQQGIRTVVVVVVVVGVVVASRLLGCWSLWEVCELHQV